jgi:dihydrofolate reductase
MISMIWAMGRSREIGKNNRLPWHLPNDLKHFKEVTYGKTVIMGSKTFESLGKALPGRRNIVITLEKIEAPGCELVYSIEEALEKADDAFIIGGASIYKQFLPYTNRLYITRIEHDFDADIFFPEFDLEEWKLIKREKGIKDEKNPYEYYFEVYER